MENDSTRRRKTPGPSMDSSRNGFHDGSMCPFSNHASPQKSHISKLHEHLQVLKRELQADAQSQRPRWHFQEHAAQEKYIKCTENSMAKTVAAYKEAERAKMEGKPFGPNSGDFGESSNWP